MLQRARSDKKEKKNWGGEGEVGIESGKKIERVVETNIKGLQEGTSSRKPDARKTSGLGIVKRPQGNWPKKIKRGEHHYRPKSNHLERN